MKLTPLCRAALAGLLLPGPSIGAQELLLSDVTDASGLDFRHFNGMSGRLYYPEVVGSGGALFDADGDGDLDLFLVQGAMLGGDRRLGDALLPWTGDGPPHDRLYRNDTAPTGGSGGTALRFTDVTEESGIRGERYGMGAVAGDFDNDGDEDLYVLNFGRNELWRNDGATDPGAGGGVPTFSEIAGAAGVADERWSVSASVTDYDGDGWLDLWVVNYLEYSLFVDKTCLTERGEPDYCLPGAYRPVADRLYRNRGDGTFEDVSAHVGVAAGPANGLGVVSGDFDGDGRTDFYVANDLMANQLWLQRADGTFRDDALLAGAAVNREGKAEASMGLVAGDLDNDGDEDLFLTHFRRESNTLYTQRSPGVFDDRTREWALATPSWPYTAFGIALADLDLDGLLDLFVANGAVTFEPGVDRTADPYPLEEPNQLFRNLGDRFEEVTGTAGAGVAGDGVSRSVLAGDLDQDGDTDLVVTNNSGAAQILENRSPRRGSWVGVDLWLGSRRALGARLELLEEAPADGGSRRTRSIRRFHNDGGYASSGDPRVLLPAADAASGLRIRWPDGGSQELGPLEPGRYHRIERSEPARRPPAQ